ncbi:MAG: PspC domain-containing protein [Proteobacteria bacterium]|nr:PspC domain-containing protein [Pseudomonadota bacterium]
MRNCPWCAEQIQEAAVKCRWCGSHLREGAVAREWYRVAEGNMVAGVCTGLAELLGVSVTALRLAAVLLTLLGFGWGLIIYAVLWMVMPLRQSPGIPQAREKL